MASKKSRRPPPACVPELQALITAMNATDGVGLDRKCMDLAAKVEECLKIAEKQGITKPPTMYHMTKFIGKR